MSTAAPPAARSVFSGNLLVFWASAAILLGSAALPSDHVERGVRLPGLGVNLPSTCLLGRLTHTGCPACGLSRGFVLSAHGQWRRASALNPLAVPLFLLCLLQLPLRATLLARKDWALTFPPAERRLWLGVLGLVLLVWGARMGLELASRWA